MYFYTSLRSFKSTIELVDLSSFFKCFFNILLLCFYVISCLSYKIKLMLGLAGATFSVRTFTWLSCLNVHYCLWLCDLFTLLAFKQIKKWKETNRHQLVQEVLPGISLYSRDRILSPITASSRCRSAAVVKPHHALRVSLATTTALKTKWIDTGGKTWARSVGRS